MVEDFTMDSQLPPGELKFKSLDKSVMGLEMNFRSSFRTTVQHHQNPYDDQWIRDWHDDAIGREGEYDERIRFLEGLGQDTGQSLVEADWERRLLEEQQKALTGQVGGLEGQLGGLEGQLGGLETRFDDQSAAFNFGLQGLQAATEGLDAATSGLDLRLTGQADQFNEQLRLAQEGWSNTVAAQQAGWDSERAAWNQQQADWGNQFSQQQRAIETQLATERDEYESQLESIRNIYGTQTEEQRTAWEQQAAQQRSDFASQLEQYNLTGSAERKAAEEERRNLEAQLENASQLGEEERTKLFQQLELSEQRLRQEGIDRSEELKESFAQSQEQQRIADAVQRRDLEAQLSEFGNQYQADWALGSQALQSDYTNLINQASSDAERARLEQARDFERLQMDQSAAYNQKTQELAAQDRVFGTQIDELRRDLGVETDLLGSAQRDFAAQSQAERSRLEQSLQGLGQQSAAARQQLASGLGQDISNLGQQSEAARQALGSELTSQQQALQQDVTGQLGGFREDIQDYKTSLAEQKSAQDDYYAANKRFREMQIQDAERARTAASYGSPGTTLNQQVKGVRRAGSSKPGGLVRSKSPRNVFNRSGLRISSLNI